jgi:large subunit ribosomal protein L10
MSVKEVSNFRNQLAGANANCRVIKNSMIRKTIELKEITSLTAMEFKGGTAIVTGSGDPSPAARIIQEFSKSNDKLAAAGGLFEGTALSKQDVSDIASMPSREVLYSMLLSVMLGPARGLATVLNAKASSIVNVINAYKNKIEEKNN